MFDPTRGRSDVRELSCRGSRDAGYLSFELIRPVRTGGVHAIAVFTRDLRLAEVILELSARQPCAGLLQTVRTLQLVKPSSPPSACEKIPHSTMIARLFCARHTTAERCCEIVQLLANNSLTKQLPAYLYKSVALTFAPCSFLYPNPHHQLTLSFSSATSLVKASICLL